MHYLLKVTWLYYLIQVAFIVLRKIFFVRVYCGARLNNSIAIECIEYRRNAVSFFFHKIFYYSCIVCNFYVQIYWVFLVWYTVFYDKWSTYKYFVAFNEMQWSFLALNLHKCLFFFSNSMLKKKNALRLALKNIPLFCQFKHNTTRTYLELV